ncbi:MAG TPA: transglycosylase domain-containing protein [Candidatus Paceibacterota bacterium]|nr:transglycosylase domain-containing protein [Candidatus Paceibacterota bacterium]
MHSARGEATRRTLLVAALVIVGCGFIVAGAVALFVAFTPVPAISSFADREVTQSTKIYDRTGQVLLYDYNRDAKREVVPLAQISPNIANAVVAIEDSGFYEHGAIRLTSIVRAALADALGGSQGGSTITQQVVKNTLLTSKRSIVRKIHEWILAIKLEEHYSKNDILETYLNSVPMGGTLYGVESASEQYYGIPAADDDLAQGAYLAAMIQAPSYYSPYGQNVSALENRKNLVLARMKTLGLISAAQYEQASAEQVAFQPRGATGIEAPHFVFYILDYLEQKYGDQALAQGLKVTTTLDADLQTHAENIIAAAAPGLKQNFNASNEAMVAVDPATGQILAMVGSSDFFSTTTDGQYNAALADRQPGSTMKPFIYALALEDGYTRDTVVWDVPTQFSTSCGASDVFNNSSPCYAPVDFDGKYRGPMTFETALAQSINIPAIQVLYMVGIQNAINLAKSFGLATLGDASQYGLTIVLGGGEVRLLDLTSAYAGFANGGVVNPAAGILEIDDGAGNVLEKFAPSPARVLPANIANDINAMLSDNPARVPEYTLNSPLHFPGYDVAVKTGTTDDTRDAWVVGYTPSIAIGTWAGNNNNMPMVKNIAGLILAPSWHDIMAYALTKYPQTYFGEPDPIPASDPPMLTGTWQTPQGIHSLLYYFDKNDPLGGPPNPSDPQYSRWETAVSLWLANNPGAASTIPANIAQVPLSYGSAPAATSSLP